MFTGLVQALGEITSIVSEPPGKRIVLRPQVDLGAVKLGDSIAINGCCLTLIDIGSELSFEAGPETLRCTNLGDLLMGTAVNLERSLAVGDLLGGHFVTGHVDGVGTVARRHDDGAWTTMWFHYPQPLGCQMAPKGSIAVDGVSLTLVDVEADKFSVALIPHTLQATTLGRRQLGDRVNLETDLLAKYVQRREVPR
ncbi:MAG TPA: riboflavin synthase [Pirellulales bacterium]|nr:riboflavin synthase [Pirellulales bacterium]